MGFDKLIKEQQECFEKYSKKIERINDGFIEKMCFSELEKCVNNVALKAKMIEETEVTFRNGMIVEIEFIEIQDELDRVNQVFSATKKRAKHKFNLKYSYHKHFKTLLEIHPVNPCAEFEYGDVSKNKKISDTKKLNKYKKSIQEILDNRFWMIDDDKVEDSLSRVYSKVKDCSNK